jgi:MFS family permease
MSSLARRNYRLELRYAFLFSTVLAFVEGGILGVIVRNSFDGIVPAARLNFMVALLMATPEVANITSFLWTALAHGRHKVRFINALQCVLLVAVLAIAFTPRTESGLVMLAVAVIVARICGTGVVTLRSTLWRANYTRFERARATGKFSTVAVLMVAVTGFILGKSMDLHEDSFRILIVLACIAGALGVYNYGQIRMRGHAAMIKAEKADDRASRPSINPISLRRLLASDRYYDAFMTSMFILGAGNLMLAAPLVITLKERFGAEYLGGIAIVSSIPMLVMPWFIPIWARLLARVHVVRFRAIHSWVFVAAQSVVLIAVVTDTFWLLGFSAALLGIAFGGGTLAWNLGHLDFAPPTHKATQYMAVHVTLTGVRGIIAPLLAVSIYQYLEMLRPGWGAWVFAFSIVLCAAGGTGFYLLSRAMGESIRVPRER